jgi:hypothetical protein
MTTSQSTPNTDTTPPPHSSNRDNYIQAPLPKEKPNLPFSDLLKHTKPPTTIRTFYKNVNGTQTANSWDKLKQFATELHKHSIDICGLSKTNLRWDSQNQSGGASGMTVFFGVGMQQRQFAI